MKHPRPKDDGVRFSGPLRHYHRAGHQQQRSWEEWIDGEGKPTGTVVPGKWLKRVVVALAILALVAIAAGLVIELR